MRTSHVLTATLGLIVLGAALPRAPRRSVPESPAPTLASEQAPPRPVPRPLVGSSRPRFVPKARERSWRNGAVEGWVDELARLRSAQPEPVRFAAGESPKGLLLPHPSSRMVTLEECGVDDAAPLGIEVLATPHSAVLCGFRAAFPELDLPAGHYDVRVGDRPAIALRPELGGSDWLFVQEPPGSGSLFVTEVSSGCFVEHVTVRGYGRGEEGYSYDGAVTVSQAELEALRALVLATRTDASMEEVFERPRQYLDSVGLTEEVITSHVDEIRSLAIGDFVDRFGRPLDVPPDLEVLFELSWLRQELVTALLAPRDSSSEQHLVLIALPGERWIHLGTGSISPDLVPWYVRSGEESWFLRDPRISRALIALADPTGWAFRHARRHADWRETVFRDERVWANTCSEVRAALARLSYRLVPGWPAIEARFDPEDPAHGAGGAPSLPAMDLFAQSDIALDTLLVRPAQAGEEDWHAVLAQYERALEVASSQPWLQRWKRATGGRIAVVLPATEQQLGEAVSTRALWQELGLGQGPEFVLSFGVLATTGKGRCHSGTGTGLLFADGTLLIPDSEDGRGPLAAVAPLHTRFRDSGLYGFVAPDGELEVRHAR